MTGVERRMVGDREHVEPAASVEVAQLADRQRTVAPGRMCVQLAKERGRLRRHLRPVFRAEDGFPRRVSEPTTLVYAFLTTMFPTRWAAVSQASIASSS